VLEQPVDLASGKVRIEHQPGLGGDISLVTGFAQQCAQIGGAPILPDNRVVDGFAARAIPNHRGFALVGNADGGDVVRGQFCLRHRVAHDGHGRRPDRFRVVLDQAGRRINLVEFLLRGRERRQRRVEYDRPRRGGALVDGDECGQDVPRLPRRFEYECRA
jgi:hypothetical protein